jgi:hypothetical protein
MSFVTREVSKFDFDKPGACIEGVLVKYRETVFRESQKRGAVLLLANANGIHALAKATDMEDKIFPSDVGKRMRIRYVKDDEQFGTAERKMKRFEVQVDEGGDHQPEARQDDPLRITDEDIPF